MISLAITRRSLPHVNEKFWLAVAPVVKTGNQKIIMQHARIYRVWLLSEIFPKYVNAD